MNNQWIPSRIAENNGGRLVAEVSGFSDGGFRE
jgi:hypothetical protein